MFYKFAIDQFFGNRRNARLVGWGYAPGYMYTVYDIRRAYRPILVVHCSDRRVFGFVSALSIDGARRCSKGAMAMRQGRTNTHCIRCIRHIVLRNDKSPPPKEHGPARQLHTVSLSACMLLSAAYCYTADRVGLATLASGNSTGKGRDC